MSITHTWPVLSIPFLSSGEGLNWNGLIPKFNKTEKIEFLNSQHQWFPNRKEEFAQQPARHCGGALPTSKRRTWKNRRKQNLAAALQTTARAYNSPRHHPHLRTNLTFPIQRSCPRSWNWSAQFTKILLSIQREAVLLWLVFEWKG